MARTGLIHISIEDRDPNRAAQLANGYVDQFRNSPSILRLLKPLKRRLFFEQQLEQAKELTLPTRKRP